MALDDGIFDAARAARDRLTQLQADVGVARGEYYERVRRLHAAGGSFREIAAGLGLSHQRVHQIVDAAPTGVDDGLADRMRRRLRGLVPYERFTPDARDRIIAAIDESAAFGHRRVGSEHLLLSLAADPTAPTAIALTGVGATRARISDSVRQRLGTGEEGAPGRRPFTPAVRRVLVRAAGEAMRRQDQGITPVHFLLGLADDGGDAATILRLLGVDPNHLRETLEPE